MSGSEQSRLEKRIVELESQVAFQEEMHRRLDEVVAGQDRELLELRRRLQALARQLAELGAATRESAGVMELPVGDDLPPHY